MRIYKRVLTLSRDGVWMRKGWLEGTAFTFPDQYPEEPHLTRVQQEWVLYSGGKAGPSTRRKDEKYSEW